MPRARATATVEETDTPVVKRAPRRRAPAAETLVPPAATETTQVSPEPDQNEEPVRRAPVRRKAPRVVTEPVAVVQPKPAKRRRPYLPFVVVVVLFAISIGVSAAVGLSDSGTIDVAARMSEQSALQAGNDGGAVDETGQRIIPVQNSQPPSVPNGGLVGVAPADQAAFTPPPLPPEVSATTSTTTTAVTASSSEARESSQTASTTP